MKAADAQEFLMLESAANVLAPSERGLSAELTGGVASYEVASIGTCRTNPKNMQKHIKEHMRTNRGVGTAVEEENAFQCDSGCTVSSGLGSFALEGAFRRN